MSGVFALLVIVGNVATVESIDGFATLGALTLNVVDARHIVIGILEQTPGVIALALGDGEDHYLLLECDPARARQIAASLLNKADSVEAALQ